MIITFDQTVIFVKNIHNDFLFYLYFKNICHKMLISSLSNLSFSLSIFFSQKQ